jgi:hypothetical protein
MGEHGDGQFAMQLGAARPEFQHVAENRNAPAKLAQIGLAEQGERRTHGGRIGIVAFVDQ